ncbi:MAG: hypothetical protein K1X74_14085 [Pirellulales bacterium]|nr:hypothetical protein [Pirellulales bacterium]
MADARAICGNDAGRRRACAAALALSFLVALWPDTARAGLGPENVILVVNSRSWASLTVANHYMRLRQIPSSHVVYLDWELGVESTSIENFRTKILDPLIKAIRARGLGTQIDAIVYSADFPFAIDISEDLAGKKLPQQFTPVASLNGLTYLWDMVLTRDLNYVGLSANGYYRSTKKGADAPESQGFRNWYGWSDRGELLEAGGRHYVLSTMLAVTCGRGNSVNEALRMLESAALADGTSPQGTIYLCQNPDSQANDNIRSKVREGNFEVAVAEIKKLGIEAEIFRGKVPRAKNDVRGAVVGTALLEWNKANSSIGPGAICEHFTSFGGDLSEGASQSPLSDWLRYGAAGASGTVTEPFAIAEKFPTAFIQVHYTRGCSLAEAFYQSVSGPYQLLIVGDLLCQPWAKIPKVFVQGVAAGQRVKGTLTITPSAESSGDTEVDRFELFVDGVRHTICAAGESFTLNTASLIDGFHEIRVVAVDASPIATQGRVVLPVWFENNGRNVEFKVSSDKPQWEQPLVVSATAADALGIAVYSNSRLLGTIKGAQGQLEIEPQKLGLGPVRLRAIALGKGGPRQHVISQPIDFVVEPPAPLKGETLSGHVEGLEFQAGGARPRVVTDLTNKDWFLKAGGSVDKPFILSGYFDVTAAEVYQFHIRHDGRLKLRVDDKLLFDGKSAHFGNLQILPVHLAKGSHRLSVEAAPDPEVRLEMRFGGQGVRSIRGRQFWHRGKS